MGVFYRAGEFIGGISKELVDKIGSATLTTTAKDLSGAVNELNSGKANKATTLLGYGITDAKIENGTITLGSNTITPLTSHQDISGKADKATTLAGYGITDAKISNGTITLGNNSITPLTTHQTVTDASPTLSWGATSKVATIGNTDIHVTMPSNPNTDTKVTQTASDSDSSVYELLFSGTADNTTRTEGARKASNLTYKPGSSLLDIKGGTNNIYSVSLCAGGVANVTVSKKISDTNHYSILDYNDITLHGSGETWDGTNTSLKSALAGKSNTGHTHPYLPLSGGTCTGAVWVKHPSSESQLGVNNTTSGKTLYLYAANSGTVGLYSNIGLSLISSDTNKKVTIGGSDYAFGSRLNFAKALTNENVGSGAQYFTTLTSSWGKFGYSSVADVKTVLGLGSAAYTNSTAYATSGHTHSSLSGNSSVSGNLNVAGSIYSKPASGDAISGCLTSNSYQLYLLAGTNGNRGIYVTNTGYLIKYASDNVMQIGAVDKAIQVRCSEVGIGNSGFNAYRPIKASAFTVSSSRLVKENIKPMTDEEAKKILNIDIVSFDYKQAFGGEKGLYGVIAEDIMDNIPSVVNIPDDYDASKFDISKSINQPILSIDYSKFIPYILKTVQLQQKEIEQLKSQLLVN